MAFYLFAYNLEYHLSTPFQNRLVGTVIVAAVIIIFLPDILDGEKNSHQTDFDAIPDIPVFSGKLIDKKFPEQKTRKKMPPALSNELAQDDVLRDDTDKELANSVLTNTDQANNNSQNAQSVVSATIKEPKILEKKSTDKVSVLPEKAVPKRAWVIHLGSFKHKQNVTQLLAKLKKNGYTTFTRPIKTKQGTLTKVFVGPELIKSSLTKKLPALKKLTNTQGKVAPFYPTK